MTDEKKPDQQVGRRPRILIVGGVAGGASCAARARRLMEKAEIIVFERGPHVSFASCGLPYYVGNVIKEENDLLVATPELFKNRFNIQVKLRHEVISIDRTAQEIKVINLSSGEITSECYDALVLSPGATAVRPPVPGIDLPGVFSLRTIEDSRNMKKWIAERKVQNAAVIGGGFIGLETAENLVNSGIQVTIIEQLPQIMPNLDPEIAILVQKYMAEKKVEFFLEESVISFDNNSADGLIRVKTRQGKSLDFDMVLLSTGVRPDIILAQQAGLEIGKLGGIRVNEQMQTSDSKIWAAGDAVEVKNCITGELMLFPMAGPASRQGRIAADVIAGRHSCFRGVEGTMVCKVFGKTVAATGVSEKTLEKFSPAIPYEKVYLHPGHHAGYYPGASVIDIKLIFSLKDGRILGVQAVGEEGVERRIDVIAMAIQKGSTVYDLEEAEMCYAPQFGSAKDPVNMAGMIAANVLRGDSPVLHWRDMKDGTYLVLDVREPFEYQAGHYEGAVNIPLPHLRTRLNELPVDKEIRIYCGVGQRSYYAVRILKQKGYNVKNISGGFTSLMGNK